MDVDLFCKSKGIKHKFLASRTPQQNGVVERKNRVLQEMARMMIHMHNTPWCNFGQKWLILHVIWPIRFFLGLEHRRHLTNYGLRENLVLNFLWLLVVNAIFLGMGRTLGSFMLNLV